MNADRPSEQKLIDNERAKLTATYVNNLAVALVVLGTFAPAIGLAYGAQGAVHGWPLLLALAWFAAGITLHLFARSMLRRLQP